MKSYRFDQIPLISVITQELNRQNPGLPADARINVVIAAANSIIAEYAREPIMAAPGMGLTAWLDSDDTGSSSLYMAYDFSYDRLHHWDARKIPRYSYPYDPDDLGRCIRLIEAVPEFGVRIHEMAHRGAHWEAVVRNWDKWVEMYQAGNTDSLHTAMKDAFAKVDAR